MPQENIKECSERKNSSSVVKNQEPTSISSAVHLDFPAKFCYITCEMCRINADNIESDNMESDNIESLSITKAQMTTQPNGTVAQRQHEIMAEYFRLLDEHLSDLHDGRIETVFGVKDFAERLHIHPTHLSNTIKHVTGQSPCSVFEERLCAVAKRLLVETTLPIAEIAHRMTYDPSNFTKFFKRYAGMTPKAFREQSFRETLQRS